MCLTEKDKQEEKWKSRWANEWYVRKSDERYWSMTKHLVEEEKMNAIAEAKQMIKKEKESAMATLEKGGIAIAILVVILHLLIAALRNR